jgi:hypothetical protein
VRCNLTCLAWCLAGLWNQMHWHSRNKQTNKQTGISQINPSYPSQVGGNLFGKEHMHYLGSAEYQRV